MRSSPAGGEEKFSENFPPFFPPEIVVQKLRVTYLVFRISFLEGKGRQGEGAGGGEGTESAGVVVGRWPSCWSGCWNLELTCDWTRSASLGGCRGRVAAGRQCQAAENRHKGVPPPAFRHSGVIAMPSPRAAHGRLKT